MKRTGEIEITGLPTADPAAEFACAFGIAFAAAPSDCREELARGIIPPVRDIDDGIEVSFSVGSWNAVRRYVEIESRRCPALSLSVRRAADAIILTVTGRWEA